MGNLREDDGAFAIPPFCETVAGNTDENLVFALKVQPFSGSIYWI
jgi:hypothetical protein